MLVDTGRTPDVKAWQVVTSVLPDGERLPTLVRRDTWIPAALALRWAVLARRLECAASTLGRDIDGLRYLYAWAEARFSGGLEARLAAGPLGHSDLLSLRDYLRHPQPTASGGHSIGGPFMSRTISRSRQAFLIAAAVLTRRRRFTRQTAGPKTLRTGAMRALKRVVCGPVPIHMSDQPTITARASRPDGELRRT